MLRRAWQQPGGENRTALIVGGWAVVLATLVGTALAIGPVRGTAVAIGFVGLAALVVVALGGIYRPPRDPRLNEVAPEPLEGEGRHGRFRRGLLKTLLAGPLGCAGMMLGGGPTATGFGQVNPTSVRRVWCN